MPLIRSGSDAAFRSNVAEMIKAGHPRDQSLAAAFRNQRQYRASGGPVADALALARAIGGYTPPSPSFGYRQAFRQEMAPSPTFRAPGLPPAPRMSGLRRDAGGYTPPTPTFGAREAFRQEERPGRPFNAGLINSATPGRTDVHALDLPGGSYVIPSDVVAGLGEGNSLSGSAVLDKMMNTQPYGIKPPPHRGGGRGIPTPPPAPREGTSSLTERPTGYAHGGSRPPIEPGRVPIMGAGGEYVIPPSVLIHHPALGNAIPGGSPKHLKDALGRAHRILDAWVLSRRKKDIKTLSKLPGPAK